MEDRTNAPLTGYMKSVCLAILSIPFAVMAAPLLAEDSAAFYFMGVSLLFVVYSLFSLHRA